MENNCNVIGKSQISNHKIQTNLKFQISNHNAFGALDFCIYSLVLDAWFLGFFSLYTVMKYQVVTCIVVKVFLPFFSHGLY